MCSALKARLVLVGMSFLGAAASIAQTNSQWLSPVSGSFHDPARWTPSPPGIAGLDDATFGVSAGGPFIVSFPSPASLRNLNATNQVVTLDLQGTTLSVGGWLRVGEGAFANGSLSVTNGTIAMAAAPREEITIGWGTFPFSGSGVVNVTGAGSVLNAPTREIKLGRDSSGSGTLNVTNGAHVTACAVTVGSGVAGFPASSGTLTVSGPGSRLQGFLLAGGDATGTATFSNQAEVSSRSECNNFNHNVYVGINAPGTVTIESGAQWNNINGLWIGGIYFDTSSHPGLGRVEVRSGGQINSPSSSVFIGSLANETGTLKVSGADSYVFVNSISVGGGSGGGTGSLELEQDGLVSRVTVNPTGTLRSGPGGGTIFGENSLANPALNNAGLLSPGISTGAVSSITVDGAFRQLPSGTFRCEIGGTAPGTFDSINVTGVASLDGQMIVNFVGGFVPSNGHSWQIINAPVVFGSFASVTLPTLPSPLSWQQVIGAGGGGVTIRIATVTSLSLPPQSNLGLGYLRQIRAFAQSAPFGDYDVTGAATWSSDHPSIVSVSPAGMITGVSAGQTVIRASYLGFTASTLVTVVPVPNQNPVRISVNSSMIQGNGYSYDPEISGDGSRVAFVSEATNLVAGDTGSNGSDILLFNRTTSALSLVTLTASNAQFQGFSFDPCISANGSRVAFTTGASNVSPGDVNNANDVFLRQLPGGVPLLISASTSGSSGGGASDTPSISGDGTRLAFASAASNLVPGDSGLADIFLRDLATLQTTRVSVSLSGGQPDDRSDLPIIARSGGFVAFRSWAKNLTPDTLPDTGIFVRDLQTQTTELVSLSPSGSILPNVNGTSSISADGRFVVFEGPYDGTEVQPVALYMRDRLTDTTTLVSTTSAGAPLSRHAFRPRITPDAKYLAFYSRPTLASPDPGDPHRQVYRKNLRTGFLRVVSVNPLGERGNDESSIGIAPSISDDGRFVAFSSLASNLAPGDSNSAEDVFLFDFGAPCPGDYNETGDISLQDLFDFLAAWFAGRAGGDFNNSGDISVQDLFDFLAAWFAGCP